MPTNGSQDERPLIDLTEGRAAGDRTRVVVVDDSEPVRRLLRLTFATDARFELTAEGSSGEEAVELVRLHRPDVVVLDRLMPGMGGLAAVREVHRCSPDTEIILYTAEATAHARHVASSAGALAVIDKEMVTVDLADFIARTLVRHWAEEDADVELTVGPVSSAAARVWIANTRHLLACLRDRPDVLDPPVPEDVLDAFEGFLDDWARSADTEEFLWVGRAPAEEVSRLVGHWAAVDSMTNEQLEHLGCSWSPPEGAAFFAALTEGTLKALAAHERTQELSARLSRQWNGAAPD